MNFILLANEAYQLMNTFSALNRSYPSLSEPVKRAYLEIIDAAMEGDNHVEFPVSEYETADFERITYLLESLGYSINVTENNSVYICWDLSE